MLFIGQAANYTKKALYRHLFTIGLPQDSERLRQYLAKRYQGDIKHVALFNNGRSALAMALKMSLPRNSKVVTSGFTCQAVLEAIKGARCVPIYADIEPKTLHFTADILRQLLTKHPDIKAIIIQNTLGNPVDIVAIEKLAKTHQLVLIEDLAHCTGMTYADGREAGTVGDFTALSFGKNKSIDTITGGALVVRKPDLPPIQQPTKRPSFAASFRARWYPVFGAIARALSRPHTQRLAHFFLGACVRLHLIERSADAKLNLNTRLSHWQAKLALNQLQTPLKKSHFPLRQHYFVYDRDDCLESLLLAGFDFAETWYDVPISPARYYAKTHFPEAECPVATLAAKHIINAPRFYSTKELKPALDIIRQFEISELSPALSKTNLWEKILQNDPTANFLQSPAYAKTQQLLGNQVLVRIFNQRGAALMTIRKAKRGRYLEIAGGPLIDWQNTKTIKASFKLIRALARKYHCVFVRFRPQLLNTPANRKILRQLQATPAQMHLAAEHTVILDLTQPEETILANFRRQTRYEVRRADRLGIQVTSGNSLELFKEFHAVQAKTAARQHFIPPNLKTLLAEREGFGDQAKIYVARTTTGEPIAYGLILIFGQEAIYYEAASTELNRKLPGAYALQWQVIRDLKNLGIKRYNLWGIAPPNQPNHRYAGVTLFKTGFGGEVTEYIPAHDIIIHKHRYRLTYLFETIRKKWRHL